jgi:hypothetical protein
MMIDNLEVIAVSQNLGNPAQPPSVGISVAIWAKALRQVAANPQSSEIFYLAADQIMLAQLRYKEGSNYKLPLPQYKNMVGTILLETALRLPADGSKAAWTQILDMQLGEFCRKSQAEQIALLGDLWDTCYKPVVPSTSAKTMVDGLGVTTGDGSLPSSLKPRPGSGYFTSLDPGPEPQAWSKWQIGFRVEGGKSKDGTRDDLTRVINEGIRPLQKSPDLAVLVAKKYYHGHKSSIAPDLYIGYQNRDLYNESGTCVARSLIGGTAFPYRETTNNKAGLHPNLGGGLQFQYLFAVDCSALTGVDTEDEQIKMQSESLWRPGEKAFPGIPKEKVLGWVRVIKKGKPANPSRVGVTGWAFELLDSQWTWLREPYGPRRIFLDAELAAWQANRTYVLMNSYDFQGA